MFTLRQHFLSCGEDSDNARQTQGQTPAKTLSVTGRSRTLAAMVLGDELAVAVIDMQGTRNITGGVIN
jgi:hypothetical protein